jgi:hypothetical protein
VDLGQAAFCGKMERMERAAGWPGPEPQTRFWIGEDGDSASLDLSHGAGALLFSEGFWQYCKVNVPAGWESTQFNGPWEGGWIDSAGLDAFIDAIRHWTARYEQMEGTVRSAWGWDDNDLGSGIDVAPDEMLAILGHIEALALEAKTTGASLYFDT